MNTDSNSTAPLGDHHQTTRHLLMVRPSQFGHNPETAESNPWQRGAGLPTEEVKAHARTEFDGLVTALLGVGANPIVISDPPGPVTPDAVFPNNWISSHGDGTVVLYPLLAQNRRAERRRSIIGEFAGKFGFRVSRVLDLSDLEARGWYLEGTGSLVLDRRLHIAFAARSPRTHASALAEFARLTGYRVIAFDSDVGGGRAVYHTNVLLSLGKQVAILCSAAIPLASDLVSIRNAIDASNRAIVDISVAQLSCFAANSIEFEGAAGPVTALSITALASLRPAQRRVLERHSTLLPVDVATIERVGGGSVRCMLAEIHLPGGVG